jgi:uncharacterized protein (DUF362 family)
MNKATDRRRFLKTTLLGGLGIVGAARWAGLGLAQQSPASRVVLTAGDDRTDIAFRSLKPLADEVARAIGDRCIIIKPNNVAIEAQLAATHADTLAGIFEFLKSIGKLGQAVVAESAGAGPTMEGFANYNYPKVAAKYGVKLVDLDQEPVEVVYVFDEKDFRPHAVRMSRMLLDPRNYLISAARMKTHDRVMATLSLKNIVFGAPIKDTGVRWGKKSPPGAKCDKPIAHGSGFRAINFNLFQLAQRMHPHLALIDGFEGMEGNGPIGGTPVDHRVCVAGTDWMAADRVAIELMGIDFAKVGYLNYCGQAGLGETDLKRIEVVDEPLARHVKTYKLANNVEQQIQWMKPPA